MENKNGINYEIAETLDYKALMDLFMRNGLEVTEEDPVPTDIVKGWKADIQGLLIGGCVLSLRQEDFIIDGIAIESEYRKSRLGSELLHRALDEAKKMGGKSVYLVAKAPGFFRKHGFGTIERDDAPLFFECFTCPQYLTTCFPEVMKYTISE